IVDRAKPEICDIKLTPPRPRPCASKATKRRRLCSFKTGAISRYRLRAARTCAARIIPPRYVKRFPLVNPPPSHSPPPVAILTHLITDEPLVRRAEEAAKPNEQRLREYADANFPIRRQKILSPAPV